MPDDPLARMQTRSGVRKQEAESIPEYVRRVGEAEDVDDELVEDAIDYLTRWQYSRNQPESAPDFQRFLAAVGEPVDEEGDTTEAVPQTEDTPEQAATPDADVEPSPSLTPLRADRHARDTGFHGALGGSEPRWLLLSFAVMVTSGFVLGTMMAETWVPGNVLFDRGKFLASDLLGMPVDPALELLGSFALGTFLALLALLIADVKKRVQGVLLSLATILAIIMMGLEGMFVTDLDLTSLQNVGALVLGLGSGLLIESGELASLDRHRSSIRRPTRSDGALVEFRVAAYAIFIILSLVVLLSLAQAYLADVARVWHAAAGLAFLFTSYEFIQYDSETQYVTLGPAGAGKSMLLVGLCLELLDADGPHPNPNESLQRALEQVSNLQPGEAHWPIPSTPPDELNVSRVEVIAGYWFPRRLELTALDYAGQHLARVANLLADGEDTDETVAADVADWVRGSDTLVVVLDVERLVHPEKFHDSAVSDTQDISWGLEHYVQIIEATDPEDVIVVATKCDILLDQGRVDAPTVTDSFQDFRGAVTEDLSQRRDVTELLTLTGETEIHPTYFATEHENGTYRPRLDERGDLMPAGFGHLIEELQRRQ